MICITDTISPSIPPVGTINFRVCQHAGTIWTQEQTRVGSINISLQLRTCVRTAVLTVSAWMWNLHSIVTNQPKLAVLYNQAIVRLQIWVISTSITAYWGVIKHVARWATIIVHTCSLGIIWGWGSSSERSSVGTIQGRGEFKEIHT